MAKLDQEEESGGSFLVTAFFSLLAVVIIKWLRPETIPFSFWHFWVFDGTLVQILFTSWPIFVWGAGINVIFSIFTRNDGEVNYYAERILVGGGLISFWAGVAEEISFRWLIFYWQIAAYKLLNLIFFGWLGFGILEWVFINISGPLADFATLGYLNPYLFNGFGWAVGAAILSSNGKFRNGHAYQGFLGFVNSWFVGMFFFYIMFVQGLPAAILVHFLYDLFIFIVRYIDAVIERKLGWI